MRLIGRVMLSAVAFCLLLSYTSAFAAQPLRIGVVLSIGGLGDRSFNDATYEAIMNLRKTAGCMVEVVEPAEVSSIEPALHYLAEMNLSLVVAVGIFANDPLRRTAAKYPEQAFAIIDSVVNLPNVVSVVFDEKEGSFFAGAFAGLLSKTNRIGFLGGMRSPIIDAFEIGFIKGAKFVNPDIEIMVEYVGDTPEAFIQPDVAKELALKMADSGCDFIYHAAGRSGLGLIDAARQSEFLVIGVDTDQSTLAPGRVAASVVKRIDVALSKVFQMVAEDRFAGSVLTLGLADAGVELVLSRFNKGLITPLVSERLYEVETFLRHKTSPTAY